MKRSIKSETVTNLNAAARNVDLRHVNLIRMEPIAVKPGALRRSVNFIVRTTDAAFTAPGIALFIAGVVFGLGVIAHH